ncbi:DUF302 domain-containing protein [Ruegeria sp. PrR005]|nr:DUF302 domain-containing protein [Ruegeria sp. PrR005]
MRLAALALITCLALPAFAGDLTPRPGWAVHVTAKTHAQLVEDTRAAITANGLGIVTQAGPTEAAARRGITIPGNRVIGAFNNDFAVRILALSTAAMIEAPIRFYVSENANGTATLGYKLPSQVFAPYLGEGGSELAAISAELDARFAAVAAQAIASQ